MKYLTYLSIALMLFACTTNHQETEEPSLTKVKLTTNKGDIIIQLYNETPLHRDNFIKIVNAGVLDSVLFHRVIENFMIQGGDTDSKNAQPGDTLGSGGLPYTVPAEFDLNLFHKKGVLAAARETILIVFPAARSFTLYKARCSMTACSIRRRPASMDGWQNIM